MFPGVTDAQRAVLVSGTKNAMDFVCRKTGYGTPPFVVMASPNAQDLGQSSNNACGTSGGGVIRFNTSSPNCGEGYTERFMTQTTAHEYFHQVQQSLGGVGPLWLLEGAAQFVGYMAVDEANLRKFPEYVELMERAVARDSFVLAQLETSWNPSPGSDVYSYAAAAVNLLTSSASWKLNSLMRFWERLGLGVPWRQAFQDTFGLTVEAFYAQFEQHRAQIVGGPLTLTYLGAGPPTTFGTVSNATPYFFQVGGVDLFSTYGGLLSSMVQAPVGNAGWGGAEYNILIVYMQPTTPSGPATARITLPDSRSASASFQVIQTHGVQPPTPVVTQTSPQALVLGGVGRKVEVVGQGFVPGTRVLINGVSVPVMVFSDSRLEIQLSGKDLLAPFSLTVANGSVESVPLTANVRLPDLITVQPTGISLGSRGGSGTLTVLTAPSTFWRALSGASWLSITVDTLRGTVSYLATLNLSAAPRSATINIGGVLVTINQSSAVMPVTAPLPISEVESGSIQSGYVVVTPDPGTLAPTATVTFGVVRGGIVESQAGILPLPMTTSGLMFVETIPGINRNFGLAIANPGSATNSVTLTLIDQIGASAGNPSTFMLRPYQQVARLIHDLFPEVAGSGFRGSLRVEGSTAFGVVAFRLAGNELSTLPLAASIPAPGVPQRTLSAGPGLNTPAPGTVGGASAFTIPHFAAGGNWATQIALVNGSSATATGRIDVFDQAGNPMSLTMNGERQSTFTYGIPPAGTFVLAARDENGQTPF
jgi:hypothetical protein